MADAGGADAVHRQGFHRMRGHLALDHVGEARHQRIAARRAAGQHRHVGQLGFVAPKAVADGVGGELRVAEHGFAFRADRVMALLDAVLGQDALLDAPRDAVQRRDVAVHIVIGHGLARHEIAGAFQVDTMKRDGHDDLW